MTSLAAYVPWTTLRSVGNSHAVRLTVLIPLVGYLLIFNDTVLRYLGLANAFGDPTPNPAPTPVHVPVRLLLIYFGLCALAVGSVLYAWRCPRVIKTYASSAGYVGGDGPHLGEMVFENIENHLRQQGPTAYQRIRDRFDYPSTDENKKQAHNAILHLNFISLDLFSPYIRLATAFFFFFFGLGLLLLLIPSMQVFWRALGIFWRSIT